MDRKYITALAFAAAAILVAGSLVRPTPHKPVQAATQPAPSPPPNRRGQMRQISDFLAVRVEESARHVLFVEETSTSGVALDARTVVTSSANHSPIGIALDPPPATAVPVRLAPADQLGKAGAWTLVVGRTSSGEPISASGILGGAADARCGDQQIRKLLLNVPMDATFAGAGLFDLGGDLVGVVGLCDGAWTAIAHTSFLPLLASQSGSGAMIWRDFGVHVREATPAEQKTLRLPEEGLFVGEVRIGSPAAVAGVQPGDTLLRNGSVPVQDPEDLIPPADTFSVFRGGRRIELSSGAAYSLEDAQAGPTLSSVKPGSRLAAAGLRAGDTLVSVGNAGSLSRAAVAKRIEANSPLWITYKRGDRTVGVLLP